MLVMKGVIIIERISPEVNKSIPLVVPENNLFIRGM